jgi:hypothetical protein
MKYIATLYVIIMNELIQNIPSPGTMLSNKYDKILYLEVFLTFFLRIL